VAVNVALPTFAADRRDAVHCTAAAPAVQQSINISSAANPLHAAAVGEWDRQTDGRTDLP